jgi:phytoene dehydrogenase-like protein
MNQIIGNLIKGKPVHIWGAGVSGLVLAYYLQKAGHQVSL